MAERWLEPLGLLHGPAGFHAVRAGHAMPLAGGPAAFSLLRLIEDGREQGILPVSALPEEWEDLLPPLTRRPLPFAGLPQDRPLVMGILNITPDSFSNGGQHLDPGAAIAAGHAMLEQGADILDIGGESTRPGATPLTAREEIARILPVVRSLATAAVVSVDTRHADTMKAVLDAGAEIVNDISALRQDAQSVRVVQEARAPVVLMHMPALDLRRMHEATAYQDVVLEVARFLRQRVETAEALGIPRGRIAIDPGIGFGKTREQDLLLLNRLPLLAGIGCRVLVGASRKRLVGWVTEVEQAADRMAGSIAVALAAAAAGASILRVHDVAETVRALRMWQACADGALSRATELA
ncbi:dihydropteroate synthase [Roseomonas marmotae]|uniref:dihydropteroate synthase n=1 Tax=Roseomonas marmotae TaxID=2768161 RepID=A0ABS3KD99_9PROT|nr:dihydropteroate synthase [Roseomonas marmotae]MBO1075415.1 dihydropteroate synthase [Roseomonas marmotae]QTI78401.1 dihydropteroate synthase [Roseomonas marmotae]